MVGDMRLSRIPSLNWLRVFEAAARHQSFVRAAHELNMSAAAISQQIAALEQYLGMPLFTRSANRVALSPVGSDFLPTVQFALQAIETRLDSLFTSDGTERVNLYASQLMAMSWLPRVVADFEANNPDIRVNLIMEGSGREDEADLSIIYRESDMAEDEGPRLPITLQHVAVARRADLPRIRTVDDLLSFRLFDVASHATGWVQLLAEVPGFSGMRTPMIEAIETTPLALLMVSQGLGLSVAHMPVCAPLARSLDLEICPLVPPTPSPGRYFLHFHHKPGQRASVQRLAHALETAAHG